MTVEPNIKLTAFSCPHCGAYTTQYWHEGYVKYLDDEEKKTPIIPDDHYSERLRLAKLDDSVKNELLKWSRDMRTKALFPHKKSDHVNVLLLHNIFLSECYNCHKWAIWVNEDLVYPSKKFGSLPNAALPNNIRALVDEARSILDMSPKGAAALLRLSIQMLCKHLGESGNNLNNDIANLVKKGLNPMVSKSLDIVRVIGNESVHPGTIELSDNKDIAIRLFDLVNIIAEQMITHPKHVNEIYKKLPESKRAAIEERNMKALGSPDKK
jgi:hypothetical protein